MNRHLTYETWPAESTGAQSATTPVDTSLLLFDASIRPNRSLPNPGFYALMAALIVISFTAGIAFMLMGAWPILGFFGLDVLAVWLCFRMSYRDGRRLETVRVTPEDIQVTRRGPTGQEVRYRLPAAWTRVEVRAAGEPEVQTHLTAMGRSLIVGALLSPKEREALGAALRDALDKARIARGPGGVEFAQDSGGDRG